MSENLVGFLEQIAIKVSTPTIQEAFIKAWPKIHGYDTFTSYQTIMVSISGGSDSDIMLDMIERIGYPRSNVHYVFFDTGLEFAATKNHLVYLEEKYGIKIERFPAKVPVPLGVKKYGVPFLSKRVSEYISRLQKHDFKWEDRSFDELYAEYPHCKAALRWWCNAWGENSQLNINRNRFLKEFLIENPPTVPISNKCCYGAKKLTLQLATKKFNPDLLCQGARKAEGGSRSTAYSSCFDENFGGADNFRPIFWFKSIDKECYEILFDVTHSDCYCKYGLRRTGCSCCPYGQCFEQELEAARQHEPLLYKAAINVFGASYEYTRKYRRFCEEQKTKLQSVSGEKQFSLF